MELDDNVECPECLSEGAYFDGLCFVCPNCDYEWGEIEDEDEDDEYYEDE
ncbi:MAG: hypothetical protein EAZ20_14455 [Bacteroidetes bacterium]|nr:MAG: hypothetical protein EAZ20_14455 [Bacteroidota bacterium]